MAVNGDIKVLEGALTEFFAHKNTKEKLSHILDKEANDWEKWLQIEFEFFLEHHLDFSAKRELRAITDKRHQSGRQHVIVDLIFRKKRTRLDKFIYVEFKLAKRATELVDCIATDLIKNYEVVNSHFAKAKQKRRSIWGVGFYRDFSPLTVNRADERLNGLKEDGFSFRHDPVYICKCRGSKHKLPRYWDGDCRCRGRLIF